MVIARLGALPAWAMPCASAVGPRAEGGGQAAQGASFLPIAQRPPAAERHPKPPGTIDPNPFEHQELLHFFRDGILGRLEHRAAFGFQLGKALRQRRDVLPCLREPVAESRWERGGVPPAEGLHLRRELPAVRPHQALRCE